MLTPVRKPKPTRSEQTRLKLIQATLDVVGRHGYELATTRMLTAQAGVNLAAIPYHFASKEALLAFLTTAMQM